MLPSDRKKAFSFPKSEKIKLKKQIETLFRTGKAFQFAPLKFIWTLQNTVSADTPIKFGVSIPKKKLAKANQRNTAKRRIREAWRLQQSALKSDVPNNHQLLVFVILTSGKIPQYDTIYPLITAGMEKLQREIAKFDIASNSN